MDALLIRLITALLGTVGFCLLFRVGRRNILWAALGGLFTYLIYELSVILGQSVLIAAFFASLFMSLYSEIMARILRSPALVFLLPSAIPIVPGGSLYYTLYNLLNYREDAFRSHAKSTLMVALGIAVGMSVSSNLIGIIRQIRTGIEKKP